MVNVESRETAACMRARARLLPSSRRTVRRRRRPHEKHAMNKTYKKIEIVGTSPKSFEDAVQSGISRAAKTVKNMAWFEVTEQRGRIGDGGATEFQVTLKIGFRLEGE